MTISLPRITLPIVNDCLSTTVSHTVVHLNGLKQESNAVNLICFNYLHYIQFIFPWLAFTYLSLANDIALSAGNKLVVPFVALHWSHC